MKKRPIIYLTYRLHELISPQISLTNSIKIPNSTSNSTFITLLSSGSTSVSSTTSPFFQSSSNFISTCFHRNYVSNPDSSKLNASKIANTNTKEAQEIIEVIKTSGIDELESKLNSMNFCLSTALIVQVFNSLNKEGVSGSSFFNWIKKSRPDLAYNVDICSLVVDNCGWLGDYDAMLRVLKDFKSKQVCITQKAFLFVPFLDSNKDCVMDVVVRVVEVLNEVGGSCRSSGIRSLIELSSYLGFFDIAKSIIEMRDRSPSYYNIVILELCRRCKFEEARELIEEIRRFGCDPDVQSYNYVLSSLSRTNRIGEIQSLFEEMYEKGCHPNSITFEILICYFCRIGKLEMAREFLNRMVTNGIEPRLSTHAALIKCYFRLKQYEAAYNYVVECNVMYKCSSNMVYSLLVSLHQKNEDLLAAQKILIEMMDNGLKPQYSVYIRVVKHFEKCGKSGLANELNARFSSFAV